MSGVIGVYALNGGNISDDLFYASVALQHRGEEGCGLSVARPVDGFYTPLHGDGLVFYRFRKELERFRDVGSYAGIGHTLYERNGSPQPVEQAGLNHRLSMGMDGVLLGFHGKNDAYMRTAFSRELDATDGDFFRAGEALMERLSDRGSYCVTALVENRDGKHLVYYRDPKGIKPLCIGRKGDTVVVASESCAIDAVEAEFMRDVEPGEMGVVSSNGGHQSRVLKSQPHSHCAFEWVYFADPASTIEGRNVYDVRKELGRRVVRRHYEYLKDADLVMASPDSGRGVAMGTYQELSLMRGKLIPFEEVGLKTPGARRTFQTEDPAERTIAARAKFHIVREVVHANKIIGCDDSIVRGTVFSEGMVHKLRRAGAREIVAVISCPPLRYPCIKDPKSQTFAAQGMTGSIEEVGRQVAKKIGVDMVCYPTVDDLQEAIGLDDIGAACLTGKYYVSPELL